MLYKSGNKIGGILKYKITWSKFAGNVGKTGSYKVSGTIDSIGKVKMYYILISGPSNFAKAFEESGNFHQTKEL